MAIGERTNLQRLERHNRLKLRHLKKQNRSNAILLKNHLNPFASCKIAGFPIFCICPNFGHFLRCFATILLQLAYIYQLVLSL